MHPRSAYVHYVYAAASNRSGARTGSDDESATYSIIASRYGDYHAASTGVVIISKMLYNDTMEVITMELVRKQTYITPAQDRAVKRLAQQQGTTEAEILRKTLDLFLAPVGIAENDDPFAVLLDLFSRPSHLDH